MFSPRMYWEMKKESPNTHFYSTKISLGVGEGKIVEL
uniref:ORF35 n=1 Tax=Nitrosopumilaceae spindle-shaped virus TaxID=3065433 RepID=A0AAT9J7C7_9VIRU